jgi:excisionase family DNA binding protein
MTRSDGDAADQTTEATSAQDFGWMGTHDAAAYLGITPRTLYRFINDGRVPAYKMGRVLRLRRSDLDMFIESTRVTPGSLEHLVPPLKSDEDDE